MGLINDSTGGSKKVKNAVSVMQTPTAEQSQGASQLISQLNSSTPQTPTQTQTTTQTPTPAAQTTYTPSAAVQQAQQKMQEIEAAKPQEYTSKYGDMLQALVDQINNRKKFKYDFNGDELFKSYADIYGQNAKQASMNAIGNASALTGGYGNSYAEQAGQQAYDETMRQLYDKGLELRDRAYQQYQDELADIYNRYGVISDLDQQDYGRYRDNYSDWLNDRNYYNTNYNNERNFDYGTFSDQRSYDEGVRQFNEKQALDQQAQDQSYAYQYAIAMLNNGKMPSDDILSKAGLSKEDAKKLLAETPTAAAGGGGGGGGNTYYVDKNGIFYKYDKNGNAVYVDKNTIKSTDKINTSEQSGTKGTNAFVNNTADIIKKTTEKINKNK